MSQLIAPSDTTPELLTRLNLQAVLPAFPELLKHSDTARTWVRGQRFRLRFSARDLRADLCFGKDGCRYQETPSGRPTIHLHYLSYRQFNKAFSGKGLSLPVPLLSPAAIPKTIAFSKLSACLKKELATPGEAGTAQRLLHLRLSLQIAAAAATVLIEHESFSRSLLDDFEDWAMRLRVDGTDINITVGRSDGRLTWGRNIASPITAELRFSSMDRAYQSLQGTLDNMAAMNEGSLRISGYLPLAERLSLVLERVPLYLQA